MDRKPEKFEVLEMITHGCRVPLARVREETRDGGRIFSEVQLRVEPADPGADARLQLAPALVPEQLGALRAEPLDEAGRLSGWAVAGDAPAHLPPHAAVFQLHRAGHRRAARQGRHQPRAPEPGRPRAARGARG